MQFGMAAHMNSSGTRNGESKVNCIAFSKIRIWNFPFRERGSKGREERENENGSFVSELKPDAH